jgi:hypothetical protein
MSRRNHERLRCGWRGVGLLLGICFLCAAFMMLGEQPAQATQCASCPIGTSPNGNSCEGIGGVMSPCPGVNPVQFTQAHPHDAKYGVDSETALTYDPDPYFYGASIHDNGGSVSSASGAISGQTPTAHTTELGGGAVAQYSGLSKSFALANNQALVVGFQGNYDSSRTSYGASPLAPAFLTTSTVDTSIYTLQGQLAYYAGSAYFGGTIGGDIGHGNQTTPTTGGTGGYSISGFDSTLIAGNVFTLSGAPFSLAVWERGAGTSPGTAKPTMSTKAAPQSPLPAYGLYLDVRGHLTYASDTAGAFIDSSGAAFGAERQHVWDAGVSARLFAMIPNNGVTWIPYAGTGFDQQFGYRDSEFIPALADTLFFGSAQTFWKAQLGVAARLPNHFTVGVRGEFADSQEFQIWGGRAYVLYSFD